MAATSREDGDRAAGGDRRPVRSAEERSSTRTPTGLETALTAVRGLDPAEDGVLLAALCGDRVIGTRCFGLAAAQSAAVEAAVVGADAIVLVVLGSTRVAYRAIAVAETIEQFADGRVQVLAMVYLPDLAEGTAWTDLKGQVGDGVVHTRERRLPPRRRRLPAWVPRGRWR
ncbi:hypothetical protein [Nocardia sp. NPDC003963]